MAQFEENKQVSLLVSWLILLGLCAGILAWGFFVLLSVPDRQAGGPHVRQWDFNVFPDAPGQSAYSSQPPPAGPPPRQIAPPPWLTTSRPSSRPTTMPTQPSKAERAEIRNSKFEIRNKSEIEKGKQAAATHPEFFVCLFLVSSCCLFRISDFVFRISNRPVGGRP